MLTLSALAFVAMITGAATAQEPITGAFGFEFDEPIEPARLGASVAEPPYPLPPLNLEQTLLPDPPGELSGWYLFDPAARPELLDGPDARFLVLRSHTGFPVRILAEHAAPDCANDVLWLTRSLARKYSAEDDPFGAERPGFRHSARFVSPAGQVDISCGDRLLIEYTDPSGYAEWLRQRARRLDDHREAEARLAEQTARLERARQRRFADDFTVGDRFTLQGAFGLTFGEPLDGHWFVTGDPPADEPVDARPPPLPGPLDKGRYTVTVGPDRVPVRIAGEFEDADAALHERFAGALREKYGPPIKDTPHHKIHKVNGDYLIARYVPAEGIARVVFIDDRAREAQQAREAAARAARLADQERQFAEETAGL